MQHSSAIPPKMSLDKPIHSRKGRNSDDPTNADGQKPRNSDDPTNSGRKGRNLGNSINSGRKGRNSDDPANPVGKKKSDFFTARTSALVNRKKSSGHVSEDEVSESEARYREIQQEIRDSEAQTDYLLELSIRDYDRDMRILRILLLVITLIALFLSFIICWILFVWLEGFSLHPDRANYSDYNVHLICTIVGFVMAPAYGMLIYRIFPHARVQTLTLVHITVLMTMSVLATYGIKIGYDSHHVYGANHLFSLHGWLGVTLTILLFFLILSGNWLYFSGQDLPRMKAFHNLSGVMLFALAAAASISGILTRSKHLLVREGTAEIPKRVAVLNTLGVAITLFAVLVRYVLTDRRFRRRPRPGSEPDRGSLTAAGPRGRQMEVDFMHPLQFGRSRSSTQFHGVSFVKPSRYHGSETGVRLTSSMSRRSVVSEGNLNPRIEHL